MVRTAPIDATTVKTALLVVYNMETVMRMDVLTPVTNLHYAKVKKEIEIEENINLSSLLFAHVLFSTSSSVGESNTERIQISQNI